MWNFVKSFNTINTYLVAAIFLLLVVLVYFNVINPV